MARRDPGTEAMPSCADLTPASRKHEEQRPARLPRKGAAAPGVPRHKPQPTAHHSQQAVRSRLSLLPPYSPGSTSPCLQLVKSLKRTAAVQSDGTHGNTEHEHLFIHKLPQNCLSFSTTLPCPGAASASSGLGSVAAGHKPSCRRCPASC